MPVPPGQPVVCCSVALREVEPLVWRRLLVPGGVRLDKLHRIFQTALGWHEDHDHMRGWIGGAFDPTEFDLAHANARLQALR